MDYQSRKDGELLESFATQGDEMAFEELIRRHAAMVHGVTERITMNPQDAKDAAQSVFLVLSRKAKELCTRESLAGWLYTTARFVSLKMIQSESIRRVRETESVDEQMLENDRTENVQAELKEVLESEIGNLPEKYRIVVILKHLENRTQEEIANILGVKMSAISMRLTRAHEMLSRKLVRRGVTVACGTLLASLSQNASASASASLVTGISNAVTQDPTHTNEASFERVNHLTENVLVGLFQQQLKSVLVSILVVTGTLGALGGVGYWIFHSRASIQITSTSNVNEALFLGIWKKDFSKVREAIGQGADVNSRANGDSALILAAGFGHQETVRLLIEHGADVNAQTVSGETALMRAAMGDTQPEIWHLLLEKNASPKIRDASGETAQTIAAKWGKRGLVEELAKRGCAYTPTIWTCAGLGDVEGLRRMIQGGRNVNEPDNHGHTALMYAAAAGHVSAVKFLIESKANLDHATKSGFTALYLAESHQRTEVVELLKLAGARRTLTSR
jgi:RNA polymerase sigma factor (sigma-70 family)